MTPQADNALTALERARQAQERYERRIDVQLRLSDSRCSWCGKPFSEAEPGVCDFIGSYCPLRK